jgi:hypothetical protein
VGRRARPRLHTGWQREREPLARQARILAGAGESARPGRHQPGIADSAPGSRSKAALGSREAPTTDALCCAMPRLRPAQRHCAPCCFCWPRPLVLGMPVWSRGRSSTDARCGRTAVDRGRPVCSRSSPSISTGRIQRVRDTSRSPAQADRSAHRTGSAATDGGGKGYGCRQVPWRRPIDALSRTSPIQEFFPFYAAPPTFSLRPASRSFTSLAARCTYLSTALDFQPPTALSC